MRLHSTTLPELTAEVITSIPIFSQGTYKLPSTTASQHGWRQPGLSHSCSSDPPPDPTLQLAKEFCLQSQMGKELCNTGVLSYYTLKSALVVPSLERRWIQNVFPEKSSQRIGFRNPCFTTSPTPPPHTQRCGDSQCTQMCSILNQSQDILNAHNLQALKKRMLDTHLC